MKKTNLMIKGIFALLCVFGANLANAQYNAHAGQNKIIEAVKIEIKDDAGEVMLDKISGEVMYEIVEKEAEADQYGNAAGPAYDLAVDGAFEGQTVAVLHLYTGEGFDFSLPKAALKEKGFSVYRWMNQPPSPAELKEKLAKACQLWIISDKTQKLNDEHLAVIKESFDSGKGLYIWGDNAPYYADANFVAQGLFGTTMSGNTMGDKTVGLQEKANQVGVTKGHLITTGIQNVYEGITIATLEANADFTPIIHGSSNNVVTSVYEKEGKRAIFDGGFTRLYVKWDTAGTDRYVKNAAAWLVNYERFGADVLGME